MAEPLTELECNHCGDIARISDTGLWSDGDGESCLHCGFPGHVVVNGDEWEAEVYWECSDDVLDRCDQDDCDECNALDEEIEVAE